MQLLAKFEKIMYMGFRVTLISDVYPPERGETGQSLPRLARFHLGPI